MTALPHRRTTAPRQRVNARVPLVRGLVNFLGIGTTAALSFVALSSLLLTLFPAVPAWIINTACYAAFIGPVYLLQRRFSFRSDAPHRHALPRYLAVQAMALVLAALFSVLVHDMLTLPTVLSSTLVIGLTSGVNFFVLRTWAFARHRSQAAAAA